jgi:hypothetical protein
MLVATFFQSSRHHNNIWLKVKIMKLFIVQFSQAYCNFLNLYPSLNMKGLSSTTTQRNR